MKRYYIAFRDKDQKDQVAEAYTILDLISQLPMGSKYYIFSYEVKDNPVTDGDGRTQYMERDLLDDKFETEVEVKCIR